MPKPLTTLIIAMAMSALLYSATATSFWNPPPPPPPTLFYRNNEAFEWWWFINRIESYHEAEYQPSPIWWHNLPHELIDSLWSSEIYRNSSPWESSGRFGLSMIGIVGLIYTAPTSGIAAAALFSASKIGNVLNIGEAYHAYTQGQKSGFSFTLSIINNTLGAQLKPMLKDYSAMANHSEILSWLGTSTVWARALSGVYDKAKASPISGFINNITSRSTDPIYHSGIYIQNYRFDPDILPRNVIERGRWHDYTSGRFCPLETCTRNVPSVFTSALNHQEVGGISLPPSVGGVWLAETAQLIGKLKSITGAYYDSNTNRLILVGDADTENTALPPIRPEYLATAIKAVEGFEAIGMTIDPNPQNALSETMVVRFFGGIENTRLGSNLFEADRMMKSLSIGVDNITKEPIQCAVDNYQSVTDMELAGPQSGPKTWSRFWLVPNKITAHMGDDNRSVLFDPISISVRTETMRWITHGNGTGKLVPAGSIRDPHAEAFAAHLSSHYEVFAKEFPVYQEVKEIARAVALAKWLKDKHIPINKTLLRTLAEVYPTPMTTPASIAQRSITSRTGRTTHTLTVRSFGGVDMQPEVQAQQDATGEAFKEHISADWQRAQTAGQDSFRTRFQNQDLLAIALPAPRSEGLSHRFTISGDDLPSPATQSTLPGFSRFHDSRYLMMVGEFGRGGSLLLPKLEFKNAAEQPGQTQWISIAGQPNYHRIKLQNIVLTNAFALSEVAFNEHFVDEDIKRIGLKPVDHNDDFRGIYPDGESSYHLLLKNGDEAIFDNTGKLLAYFVTDHGDRVFYDWDTADRLTALRYVPNGAKDKEAVTRRFEYDNNHRIRRITENNRTVRYDYDETGHLMTPQHTREEQSP